MSALAQTWVGVGEDLGPHGLVEGVGESTSHTGTLLDEHFMTLPNEGLGTGRNQSDPVLVGLDFLRHADKHFSHFSSEVELERGLAGHTSYYKNWTILQDITPRREITPPDPSRRR